MNDKHGKSISGTENHTQKKPRIEYRSNRAWFRRLLQHPDTLFHLVIYSIFFIFKFLQCFYFLHILFTGLVYFVFHAFCLFISRVCITELPFWHNKGITIRYRVHSLNLTAHMGSGPRSRHQVQQHQNNRR